MYNILMNKIAILGGAFDPPHIAHIIMADNAVKEYGYERVIFLPSYNPPHKRVVTDGEDRLNMLTIALNGRYEICDIELKDDAVGYTSEVIPRLKRIYGDFDFIIGGDSMRDLHTWHEPEKILSEVKLVVAVRDNDYKAVREAVARYEDTPKRGIVLMQSNPPAIASTDIRVLIELGMDIGGCVDDGVAEYIRGHGLYTRFLPYREKLYKNVSERCYLHSLRTVIYAMKLNRNISLDRNKVFIAALLHDCAKEYEDYSSFDIPHDSKNTPVAHAFAGAIVARKQYGIEDKDILSAIYTHTTADRDMSKLAKLIYMADMLEEGRDYPDVERLRELAQSDFEKGFVECLRRSYEYLIEKCTPIYPLTKSAYEYYNNNTLK